MGLPEKQQFNYVLFGIGVVAVVANSLLMWIARCLKDHSKEIQFAMMLACVDMGLGLLIILTSLMNSHFHENLDLFQTFCMIKGPIDFILLFLSLVLVAIIAMERLCKVKDTSIPRPVWIAIGTCTAIYTTLVAIAAIRGEFSASISGCDCTPAINESLLSACVVFALGFFMALSLVAAVFSYICILGLVKKARAKRGDYPKHSSAILRVITISFIYFSLIAPSSILIMMEGTRSHFSSHILDIVISILNALNSIANPCLILFAHSLIFDQLKSSFQPKSHFASLSNS
ncbi:hypothetical protein DSO57_1021902 [Entomophthora muscae]|uniref:Uncharacterized protein n=1 Tax=Entomophthora muscae TaxID=34485 RepID=A0ACC2T3J2_9FUNG|nr:hypothetical protein DSO57_1021902 [Entomophthora muscae]